MKNSFNIVVTWLVVLAVTWVIPVLGTTLWGWGQMPDPSMHPAKEILDPIRIIESEAISTIILVLVYASAGLILGLGIKPGAKKHIAVLSILLAIMCIGFGWFGGGKELWARTALCVVMSVAGCISGGLLGIAIRVRWDNKRDKRASHNRG